MDILTENTDGKGLLVENIDFSYVKPLVESSGEGKNYYITGIFMQAQVKNKNGRVYPKPIMEKEVARYIKEKVSLNRATGELDHPETIKINPNNVSHLITELKWDGNDVYGKARILDTPSGKILKAFTDGGVNYGVSSRALGSVVESYVQNDLFIQTVDAVLDPSAPKAFVQNVFEGIDWTDRGLLSEDSVKKYQEALNILPKKGVQEFMMKNWNRMLNEMVSINPADLKITRKIIQFNGLQFSIMWDYKKDAYTTDITAMMDKFKGQYNFSGVIEVGDRVLININNGTDSITTSKVIFDDITEKYIKCGFHPMICFGNYDGSEFIPKKVVTF